MGVQGKRLEVPADFRDRMHAGQRWRELEQHYGVSSSTIAKWTSILRNANPFGFPDPEGRNYEAEIEHLEGDWMVTSDWHLPYYDVDLATHMVQVAEHRKIRNLAIVGDFWDIKWLSMFDVKDLAGSLRDDLAVAIHTLRTLLGHFDKIALLMGNHDARLFRSLRWQLQLPDLIKFLIDDSRVTGSVQPRAILHSGSEVYRLAHPKSYSQNAATVAAKLADKYQCHVLSAHGHFVGMKFCVSGRYFGGDLGGLFDIARQEYLYREGDTTHPCWIAGFWAIENGYPTIFTNRLTNWDEYKRAA